MPCTFAAKVPGQAGIGPPQLFGGFRRAASPDSCLGAKPGRAGIGFQGVLSADGCAAGMHRFFAGQRPASDLNASLVGILGSCQRNMIDHKLAAL